MAKRSENKGKTIVVLLPDTERDIFLPNCLVEILELLNTHMENEYEIVEHEQMKLFRFILPQVC